MAKLLSQHPPQKPRRSQSESPRCGDSVEPPTGGQGGRVSLPSQHGDGPALAPADAARLLSVSRATFFKMHSAGKVPLPVYLSPRCPRWLRAELLAWLEAGAPDRQTWEKLKTGGK